MTPTWFNTDERIGALRYEAATWVGTPFAGNSSSKGVGVSCQKLVGAIYAAAGPIAVEPPDVPMAAARFSSTSFVDPWFADAVANGLFVQLESDCETLPGDILGFRINRIVHHLGIALGDGKFIHAMDGIGTSVGELSDATWSTRLARIWRPVP